MRPIKRVKLSPAAGAFLKKRAGTVAASTTPRIAVNSLWKNRYNKAFSEIENKLRKMASGLDRCMYCEDNEGTAIDHFRPKMKYPASAFDWRNYLWACTHCNSNEKRDQFPLDTAGKPLLIDPTAEDPFDHLIFIPDTGEFSPADQKGAESIRVFGLWRETLEEGRRNAWVALLELVVGYGRKKRKGYASTAQKLERVIRKYPFSSVLWYLLEVSKLPNGATAIPKSVQDTLASCPEIYTWAA